jgi:hypothetical protein
MRKGSSPGDCQKTTPPQIRPRQQWAVSSLGLKSSTHRTNISLLSRQGVRRLLPGVIGHSTPCKSVTVQRRIASVPELCRAQKKHGQREMQREMEEESSTACHSDVCKADTPRQAHCPNERPLHRPMFDHSKRFKHMRLCSLAWSAR